MERKSASPPSGSTRRDLPQRCGAESTAAKIYGSPRARRFSPRRHGERSEQESPSMAAANRFAVLADEDAAVFASECRKYPSDRSTRGVGVFEAAHPTSLVDAADVFGADPEKPNSPSRITPPATAPSRATAEANKRAVCYGHQRCRRWARRVWGEES